MHRNQVDKPFDNNDDSVFKTHVLYIILNDTNCTRIQNVLAQSPFETVTWVQDVQKLRQPLPRWLQGVPTLVSKQDKKVYTGSKIIQYLQKASNNGELQQPGNMFMNNSSSISGTSLFNNSAFALDDNNTESQWDTSKQYASIKNNAVFDNADGKEHDPHSMQTQPSAQYMDNIGRSQGDGTGNSGRTSRRAAAQEEQERRLQQLKEQREALDRRFNPQRGYHA